MQIPQDVKDNFMAHIRPGKTILYTIYGYDSTYVNFYLVVDKTPRTVKAVRIGEKIVQAQNQTNYKVVADPSNQDKTIISLRLSPKAFYNDFRDIHFQNTRLHIKDLKIYDGQAIQVNEY